MNRDPEYVRDMLRLYAVTDRRWLGSHTLEEQVEQAILGGATCVQLREKALDCAAEFARYAHEHELGLTHLSLSDAMTHFGLAWEGTAHSSLADTDACRRVFEQLFPPYYESE